MDPPSSSERDRPPTSSVGRPKTSIPRQISDMADASEENGTTKEKRKSRVPGLSVLSLSGKNKIKKEGDADFDDDDDDGPCHFALYLVAIQALIIVIYAFFVRYDNHVTVHRPMLPKATSSSSSFNKHDFGEDAQPITNDSTSTTPTTIIEGVNDEPEQNLHRFYYMFQDVHVMIFVGIGFLLTFLKKYGYSAVAFNMLVAAVVIEWSIICRGLFYNFGSMIPVDITSLIYGDVAAAVIMISFGAFLGVTTPAQFLTIALFETFFFVLNEWIVAQFFQAVDVGGSVTVHVFSAYFGMAASFALRRTKDLDLKNEGTTKTSDLFSMIGTVFLWVFWPSFNGIFGQGHWQHRVMVNTLLSLAGSCIVTFAMSSLINRKQGGRLSMVHVQNATLAGGVAVGAVADLMIQPFGAILIGSCGAIVSSLGVSYVTPALQRWTGLHDSCGIHNLHGLPGILSALIAIVLAVFATEEQYGIGLYVLYPARAPEQGSVTLTTLQRVVPDIGPGYGRSAGVQALYQAAGLGLTMSIAIVTGAVIGLFTRLSIFGKVPKEAMFDDSWQWQVPSSSSPPDTPKRFRNGTASAFRMSNRDM